MVIESDKSADPHDKASALEELERVQAIAAARKPLKEFHPEFDGEHCVECSNDIPHERLKLHKVRCVECQRAIEIAQKRRYG